MNEDQISREMFELATRDARLQVISWQGVGGKSYLTRDVQFRVGPKRMAPDLIVLSDRRLWLIEIKGTHREAMAGDEAKLVQLHRTLGVAGVYRQILVRSGIVVPTSRTLTLAVAYASGTPEESCPTDVVHVQWERVRVNPAKILKLV